MAANSQLRRHDLVTGEKERTSPPSETQKTAATKPRATPAVLAGSGLLGSGGLCCPWVAWSSSLGSCAVFVVGSYHATLGYLSERGPGTGVAEHRDSQSGLASQSTFSSYPEETDPQGFCPIEYSLVLGTFSI